MTSLHADTFGTLRPFILCIERDLEHELCTCSHVLHARASRQDMPH
jgi:hypothetical protein